jgi:hypothetical protein
MTAVAKRPGDKKDGLTLALPNNSIKSEGHIVCNSKGDCWVIENPSNITEVVSSRLHFSLRGLFQ